jgi:hypothetical protein
MIKELTVTVILLLFLSVNVFADKNNEVVVKFGITPYSIFSQGITFILNNEQNKTSLSDINMGTVFYLEYFREINSIFKLGIGFAQQIKRTLREHDFYGIYSTSIYIMPKANIYNGIYSILQFGISNIATGVDEDIYNEKNVGLHYGAGIGYEYRGFIFEFLYASDNVIHKIYFSDKLMQKNHKTYQTFNFNIGYKFDFNLPI